jgi:hypothetical protein
VWQHPASWPTARRDRIALHCQHFFVTWDAQQPRGCRAYGFKSNDLPSDVVYASSGAACQLFERKPGRKAPGKLLR